MKARVNFRKSRNESLSGFGFGLAVLAVLWIVNVPSAAIAHEVEATPVVAHGDGTAAPDWCAHDHEADGPMAEHGAHCFAPAFASFSSAEQMSWFSVSPVRVCPNDEALRHGVAIGAEPPPPRITS